MIGDGQVGELVKSEQFWASVKASRPASNGQRRQPLWHDTSLELCSLGFHFTLRHHNAARVKVCVRRRCLALVPGTDGRNIHVSTRMVIGRS